MKTLMRGLAGTAALIALVSFAAPVQAQDAPPEGWQKEFDLRLNLLQSSYSSNWHGGDKGSVVWTGNFDGRVERQFSPRTNWRNHLKLAYGQTHNQDRTADGSLYWKKPDKSDDIIDFESLFRWTYASGWDPFVSFKFMSMFQDLNDIDLRSLSFNPLTFKESAGISRPWINQEDRKLMSRLGVAFIQNSRKYYPEFSPVNDIARVGSTEIAAELITEYRVGALDGRVDWESKLTLSLPFAYSGKSVFEDGFTSLAPLPDDIASYTTTLDADWENTFTANITKVISVKFYLRWVYDKYDNSVKPVVEDGALVNEADVHNAVRLAGQFKQTLALGFGYKFN